MLTRRRFLALAATLPLWSALVPVPTSLTSYVDGLTLITAAQLNAVEEMLYRGAINVCDPTYGAVRDGVTDDSAAISAAALAAYTAGIGAVYLPAGSYKIGSVTPQSGVVFYGDGVGRTILVGTAGTNPMFGFSSATAAGLVGMTLTGPTTGATCAPLYITTSTFCTFRDVRITGGVLCAVQASGDVTDCTFENIDIADTRLSSGLGVAFWLFDGATRNRVRGLRIRTCEGSGVGLDASSSGGDSPCDENTFEDVYIESANSVSGSAAVMLQGASRNQFRGLRIKGGGQAAISCSTDQQSGVGSVVGSDDNTFEGVSIEDTAGVAFYCLGSSRNRLRGKVYNPTRAAGGRPVTFQAITVNSVAFPAEFNSVDLDMVTVNTYVNPAEFAATASVEVRDNTIRYTRPFSVDFTAISVSNSSNCKRNVVDMGVLYGNATWNPGDLAADAQETTTVTVTGAALGDVVDGLSFSLDLQGMQLTGYVSAADTVTVVLNNTTAGNLNLDSGTLRVCVRRYVNV